MAAQVMSSTTTLPSSAAHVARLSSAHARPDAHRRNCSAHRQAIPTSSQGPNRDRLQQEPGSHHVAVVNDCMAQSQPPQQPSVPLPGTLKVAAPPPPDRPTQRGNEQVHVLPPAAAAGAANPRPMTRGHHPRALPISAADLPPNVIRVRDLAHVQDMSRQVVARGREANNLPVSPADADGSKKPIRYEISQMPITDVIEMVAGLLTKITATNDQQYSELHHKMAAGQPPDDNPDLDSVGAMVLAFHGKNVPAITILAYLLRIEKYCPTTYEVFLSLLVYFDRMTASVNSRGLQNLQRQARIGDERQAGSPGAKDQHPPIADSVGLGDEQPETEMALDEHEESARKRRKGDGETAPAHRHHDDQSRLPDLSDFFVVDSYNIHRLVIASVAAASKFFSDIFYTNTRLAKVGGLPLVELNHLELQFLRLNSFRLSIPVEELESYGTMLVEFYAREVQAQNCLYDDDDEDDENDDDDDLAD